MDSGYFTNIPVHHGSMIVSSLRGSAITGDKVLLQKNLSALVRNRDQCDHFGRTLLIYAVLGEQPECVSLLLKLGANINAVDKSGRSALLWAAYKNSFTCLKLLLSKGANWSLKDCEGATALHLASRHSSSKCLALILKYIESKEIDVQDNDKRTALHWSAYCGNLDNVKLLVKHKSNCGNPDIERKTPIHWAASSPSPDAADCIKVLLESAPMAINWNDHEGRGALHLAVADGTEAAVRVLASSEYCDLNILDNASRTPLHLAAFLGFSNIVKILLENGAKYSSPDANKATPLHYASLSNPETVRVLLSAGIDINERDKDGCTALMWAVGASSNNILSELFEHGADVNATDKHGTMALHIAALSGHKDTVKLLLDNGSIVDAVDAHGRTSLSYACEMGQNEALLALLNGGSCINLSDHEKRTALHWAAIGGHHTICQILIKQNLDVNVLDIHGRTPLFYATFGGYTDCMSVLIECGCQLQHRDNEGFTALHWACRQGHLDAVMRLMSCDINPNCLSRTKPRYTALDLALLGDYFDVARFVVDHGGVSGMHIESEAARKIQAAYRGYRIRKALSANTLNRSKSECSFDDRVYSNMQKTSTENDRSISESLNDSVFLNETIDHIPCESQASLPADKDVKTVGSDPLSGTLLTIEDDGDFSENTFEHLQPGNPVKALLLNRKTFQKFNNKNTIIASLSMLKSKSRLLSRVLKQDPGSSLSKDRIGSSISLFTLPRLSSQTMHTVDDERRVHHHSLLQLADSNSNKQKLFRRFRKKHEIEDRNVLQHSSTFKLIRNGTYSDSTNIISTRVFNLSDSHSVGARTLSCSCKSAYIPKILNDCQSPQKHESSDDCDIIPSWCFDKTLKKIAEEEWINSLCDVFVGKVPAVSQRRKIGSSLS